MNRCQRDDANGDVCVYIRLYVAAKRRMRFAAAMTHEMPLPHRTPDAAAVCIDLKGGCTPKRQARRASLRCVNFNFKIFDVRHRVS
jgi:hypothetical protein